MAVHGDDLRFVREFDGGSILPEQFGHAEFIRLAWVLLDRAAIDVALPSLRNRLRAFAARHALAEGYHETRTGFFVREIARRRRSGPRCDDFAQFAAAHPDLLDASYIDAHYPAELLASERAREEWVPPAHRAVGRPAYRSEPHA